jgi:hypothetical protein
MVLDSGPPRRTLNHRSGITVATASGDALNQLLRCAITGWRNLLASLGQSPLPTIVRSYSGSALTDSTVSSEPIVTVFSPCRGQSIFVRRSRADSFPQRM